MKDKFDIPTGDMVRDYEMLTADTWLEFYGSQNDEPDLSGLEELSEEKGR